MPRSHSAARLFVEGLAVGGAAGVLIGLMLAPDEGREVRRRVAFLLDRWTGQLGGLVDRLGGEQAQNAARDDANAVVADAREQAARLLDEADALISEVRQRRGTAPGTTGEGRG
jgi:gas vesicle protein